MSDNPIQVAVLGMAGTTVADDGLVVQAFEATSTAGLPAEERTRTGPPLRAGYHGAVKIVVFRALFGTEERAQRANAEFERAYAELIDNGHATPIDGAADAITDLARPASRSRSPPASPAPQDKLLAALGWQHLADLALAPGGVCHSRRTGPGTHRLDATRCRRRRQRRRAGRHTSTDVDSALRAGAAIAAGTSPAPTARKRLRAAGAPMWSAPSSTSPICSVTHQSEDQ